MSKICCSCNVFKLTQHFEKVSTQKPNILDLSAKSSKKKFHFRKFIIPKLITTPPEEHCEEREDTEEERMEKLKQIKQMVLLTVPSLQAKTFEDLTEYTEPIHL